MHKSRVVRGQEMVDKIIDGKLRLIGQVVARPHSARAVWWYNLLNAPLWVSFHFSFSLFSVFLFIWATNIDLPWPLAWYKCNLSDNTTIIWNYSYKPNQKSGTQCAHMLSVCICAYVFIIQICFFFFWSQVHLTIW